MSPDPRPWYRSDGVALALLSFVFIVLPAVAWLSWVFRIDPLSLLAGWLAVLVVAALVAAPFVALLGVAGAVGRTKRP